MLVALLVSLIAALVILAVVTRFWYRARSVLSQATTHVAWLADVLAPGTDGKIDHHAGMPPPVSRLGEPRSPNPDIVAELHRLSDAVEQWCARYGEQVASAELRVVQVADAVSQWLAQVSVTLRAAAEADHVSIKPATLPVLDAGLGDERSYPCEKAAYDIAELVRVVAADRQVLRRQAEAHVAQLRQLTADLPGLIAISGERANAPLVLRDVEWFSVDTGFQTVVTDLVKVIENGVGALTGEADAHADKAARSVLLAFNTRLLSLVGGLDNAVNRAQDVVDDDRKVLEELLGISHLVSQLVLQVNSVHQLCGGWPGIQRSATDLADVINSARGRIAWPDRVTLGALAPGKAVPGHAVEALVTVVAHLLDNAVRCSPPGDEVHVSTTRGTNGLSILIDDAGVGMPADALDSRRALLDGRSPVQAHQLGHPAQIGLAVCRTLGVKHGIQVFLEHSPYGGVRAVVFLAPQLLTSPADVAGPVRHRHPATPRHRAAAVAETTSDHASGRNCRDNDKAPSPVTAGSAGISPAVDTAAASTAGTPSRSTMDGSGHAGLLPRRPKRLGPDAESLHGQLQDGPPPPADPGSDEASARAMRAFQTAALPNDQGSTS